MPYEFNSSDLDASMLYMEKQFTSCALTNRKYEWEAMQYMCGEIQYGGKITQELDRKLFTTYTYLWIDEKIFNPTFTFNQQSLDFNYIIPDFPDHPSYLQYIGSMPQNDSPLMFGLNSNADLTAALNASKALISVLIDTQPSDAGGSGGKTPEQVVKEMIENDFLKMLPDDFKLTEVIDRVTAMQSRKLAATWGPPWAECLEHRICQCSDEYEDQLREF